MKPIFIYLFILSCVSKLSAQDTLVAQGKFFNIYKHIDSNFHWYYAQSNFSPTDDEVIFRTRIKETMVNPLFKLQDSIFAVIYFRKGVLIYQSWRCNPNLNRSFQKWNREFDTDIFNNKNQSWLIYGGVRLYSKYEDNGYEDSGFIDVNTPFVIKYDNNRRWKNIFHVDGKNSFNCKEDSIEKCIRIENIYLKPYTAEEWLLKYDIENRHVKNNNSKKE